MSKPINLVVLPKVVALGFRNWFNGCYYASGSECLEEAKEIYFEKMSPKQIIDEVWHEDPIQFDFNDEDEIVNNYVYYVAEQLMESDEVKGVFEKFKGMGYTSLEIIGETDDLWSDSIDYNDTECNTLCEFTEKYFDNDVNGVFVIFRK